MSSDRTELYGSEFGLNRAPPNYRLDDDTGCLLIALIQLLGGLLGILKYLLLFGIDLAAYIDSFVFVPFVWGVYAGRLLWKGRVRGLNHSIVLQGIQIPAFSTPLLSYWLNVGPRFFIGVWPRAGIEGLRWQFDLRSHFGFGEVFEFPGLLIGVNAFALFAFTYLTFKRRRLKAKDKESLEGYPSARIRDENF